MPNKITIDLIRRKAEHNEGLIHTLEELSLHQEELETIDDTLGCNCRRLKILYLQNNIIGEMKNLHHMKELEYLNLALNNISKVEGLQSCEFLNKLDLTVNFVDMDELESSVTAMQGNRHLADLYMMGNPCQSWAGFEAYVIARLPQLERLDGKEITRTDRIKALQQLPALLEEIPPLAEEVRRRKLEEKRATGHDDGAQGKQMEGKSRDRGEAEREAGSGRHPRAPAKSEGMAAAEEEADGERGMTSGGGGGGRGGQGGEEEEEEELTKHTPEVRTAIYREMAEQKKEKEDRQRENLPRDRNFEGEQAAAVERARKREAEGTIRQCNEGKLEFRFEETQPAAVSSPAAGGEWCRGQSGGVGVGGSKRSGGSGDIVLEVGVPKHLDSSLIDVDVHPHYVSVVIKGKVLRLSLQAEVRAGEAKARRSKTTGSLVITMPKVNADQSIGLVPSDGRRRTPAVVADRAAASKSAARNDAGRTRRTAGRAPTLAVLMMEEAQAAAAAAAARKGGEGEGHDGEVDNPRQAVSIRGMVGPRHGGLEVEASPEVVEVASSAKRTEAPSFDSSNYCSTATPVKIPASPAAARSGPGEPTALPRPPSVVKGGQAYGEARPPKPEDTAVPPAAPAGDAVGITPAEGQEGTSGVGPRGGIEGGGRKERPVVAVVVDPS